MTRKSWSPAGDRNASQKGALVENWASKRQHGQRRPYRSGAGPGHWTQVSLAGAGRLVASIFNPPTRKCIRPLRRVCSTTAGRARGCRGHGRRGARMRTSERCISPFGMASKRTPMLLASSPGICIAKKKRPKKKQRRIQACGAQARSCHSPQASTTSTTPRTLPGRARGRVSTRRSTVTFRSESRKGYRRRARHQFLQLLRAPPDWDRSCYPQLLQVPPVKQ